MTISDKDYVHALDINGFVLLESALPDAVLSSLERVLDSYAQSRSSRGLESAGAGLRNLLRGSEAVLSFSQSEPIASIVTAILGDAYRPVRGILFDKTPESNWSVTWHQDLSIPVTSRHEKAGFTGWSVKDDVLHVQPPAAVLEAMVSLRIHFDASPEASGAIKFISGSHQAGVLDSEQIASWRDDHNEEICAAERGDIIAMRPLILHSSSKSKLPIRRRVLHLEFAGVSLPEPLRWGLA